MRIEREPSEDEQHESRGCLLLVGAVIAFVVSSWFTCREVVYALASRPALANVVSTEIVEYRTDGSTWKLRRVRVEFLDEGNRLRSSVRDVDLDRPLREGDQVPVEYTDRDDYPPRLIGERRWGMIALWVALFGLTVVQGVRLWLEARAAVNEAAWHEAQRRRSARSDRPVPRRDPEPLS